MSYYGPISETLLLNRFRERPANTRNTFDNYKLSETTIRIKRPSAGYKNPASLTLSINDSTPIKIDLSSKRNTHTVIGRDQNCDVQILSGYVSRRQHVRIGVDQKGRYYIVNSAKTSLVIKGINGKSKILPSITRAQEIEDRTAFLNDGDQFVIALSAVEPLSAVKYATFTFHTPKANKSALPIIGGVINWLSRMQNNPYKAFFSKSKGETLYPLRHLWKRFKGTVYSTDADNIYLETQKLSNSQESSVLYYPETAKRKPIEVAFSALDVGEVSVGDKTYLVKLLLETEREQQGNGNARWMGHKYNNRAVIQVTEKKSGASILSSSDISRISKKKKIQLSLYGKKLQILPFISPKEVDNKQKIESDLRIERIDQLPPGAVPSEIGQDFGVYAVDADNGKCLFQNARPVTYPHKESLILEHEADGITYQLVLTSRYKGNPSHHDIERRIFKQESPPHFSFSLRAKGPGDDTFKTIDEKIIHSDKSARITIGDKVFGLFASAERPNFV